MSDYKETLNLPQTDFPMKANLPECEPLILKRWEAMALYAKRAAVSRGKKKFILLDGPPYANGHLHLGHAVNKILKDIVVKSKIMSGFDSPFVPGWDCHGLPIELNVEKKFGKPGQKITASAFRAACRDYAASQIEIQREEFKRLGIVADWEHPYLTMNFHYEAGIIRSLIAIFRHHHVERGYKPVHWCLDCASALAEAEVEYAEKISPSIDVRFTVVARADFLARLTAPKKAQGLIAIPIWTTTPWTLPANQAVAVNPDLNYVLVECDEREQLLVAETLLTTLMTRYKIKNYRVVGHVIGKKLLGIKVQHPFYERQVPVVVADYVTVDAGTGAVSTAPGHGPEDYLLSKTFDLPIDNPIGDDGCFVKGTPLFSGIHVNKVDEKIIEALQSRGTLLYRETIRHSYPHCWRHKTALIFRATPQWFISMDPKGLREMALQAIDRTTWIPEWGQIRIRRMIENRPDWCISRQRVWGVPLALFIHKKTGEAHPAMLELMDSVAKQVEQHGIEAWYTLDPKTLLGNDAEHYQKSMDVLDVWFDSGVAHQCVLAECPELTFPADLVLEGSDQHRGWFQSSLLTSLAMTGESSYQTALTHGFTVDGQGRKMSKSLGNVIAPDEVINTMGADVLRLWVASIDYRSEINVSKEILTRTSETYRRIRNTARFLLANLHGFDPSQHCVSEDKLLKLDRFMLNQAHLIQQDILKAYDTYQFHLIVQKLHHFCVLDLGGFYLDIIKDRQYTMARDSLGRRSAQTTLFYIAQALVRWIAPILSFTAEEIWQYIPHQSLDSVLLATWYDELPILSEKESMNVTYWETIRAVRDAVNKEIENQRNASKLGSALEAEVHLYAAPALKKQLDALGDELRFVLITSLATVALDTAAPSEAIATDIPELRLHIVPTTQQKCARCWHRRQDVNANATYPGLCARCVENAFGRGEVRRYA